MKNNTGSFCAAVITLGFSGVVSASEFTNDDASNLIFEFSQVATCSNAESPHDFHSVKVVENEGDYMGQYGERFAVAWYGDVSCGGGSGSSAWQISFVGIGVASSAYVDLDKPPIGLIFTDIIGLALDEESNIVVKGERYDPREGSSNRDFVKKTLIVSLDVKIVESFLHVDGETYLESEIDVY